MIIARWERRVTSRMRHDCMYGYGRARRRSRAALRARGDSRVFEITSPPTRCHPQRGVRSVAALAMSSCPAVEAAGSVAHETREQALTRLLSRGCRGLACRVAVELCRAILSSSCRVSCRVPVELSRPGLNEGFSQVTWFVSPSLQIPPPQFRGSCQCVGCSVSFKFSHRRCLRGRTADAVLGSAPSEPQRYR